MERILEDHLKRVERDDTHLPIRLFPFLRDEESPRTVAIDAFVAFGRPVVWRRKVSTRVIADRVDAGESVAQIAADYDLNQEEVENAVVYERAA
jgi:uncharacterized protein (DUF433 family)